MFENVNLPSPVRKSLILNINNCIAIDIDEIVQRQLQLQMKLILINSESLCELLFKLANLGLNKPIVIVLDNARYHK